MKLERIIVRYNPAFDLWFIKEGWRGRDSCDCCAHLIGSQETRFPEAVSRTLVEPGVGKVSEGKRWGLRDKKQGWGSIR